MGEVKFEESIDVFDDYAHYSTPDTTDIIKEEPLRRFLDYWNRIRGNRQLPRKADIDPIDIPWALNNIYLVKVVPPPVLWRYLIAGNEIENAFNRSTLRGVGMNEIIANPGFDIVCKRWEPVRSGRAIVYMQGLIYKTMEKSRNGARIVLPLSDNDKTVNAIMGMSLTGKQLSHDELATARLDIATIDLDHIPKLTEM